MERGRLVSEARDEEIRKALKGDDKEPDSPPKY
jgi:hypothetical protein